MALRTDIAKFAELDGYTKACLARAVVELALARINVRRGFIPKLIGGRKPHSAKEPFAGPGSLTPSQRCFLDRAVFALGVMGSRVPWKSDCLIQALAAWRWLGSKGIATSIRVGVRKDEPSGLAAHAWLTLGETVVFGGDVEPFVALTTK